MRESQKLGSILNGAGSFSTRTLPSDHLSFLMGIRRARYVWYRDETPATDNHWPFLYSNVQPQASRHWLNIYIQGLTFPTILEHCMSPGHRKTSVSRPFIFCIQYMVELKQSQSRMILCCYQMFEAGVL